VLFYLGGSDGQLFPGYDKNNEVNPEKNYAFQSLAQNMRGVPQNTRHGESYFVINSELRVPLFSAFSKKQMRSKFIESLQLIAFIDGGSAWTGVSPWSGNNIQTETRTNFEEKPESATIIVKLNTYKDPFIFAFGPGLRANIFNYFFRFDLGWAYDTGVINAPKMHVSMTYDF
jgi:outer membrane protein assembly factor BamA